MPDSNYRRPQWEGAGATTQQGTPAFYAPAPDAPPWHERINPWVAVAFFAGMVLGMIVTRWQHGSKGS